MQDVRLYPRRTAHSPSRRCQLLPYTLAMGPAFSLTTKATAVTGILTTPSSWSGLETTLKPSSDASEPARQAAIPPFTTLLDLTACYIKSMKHCDVPRNASNRRPNCTRRIWLCLCRHRTRGKVQAGWARLPVRILPRGLALHHQRRHQRRSRALSRCRTAIPSVFASMPTLPNPYAQDSRAGQSGRRPQ